MYLSKETCKEKMERERDERQKESDRVERKCVHSRLILIGRTHCLQVQTMLMQQKHALVWFGSGDYL